MYVTRGRIHRAHTLHQERTMRAIPALIFGVMAMGAVYTSACSSSNSNGSGAGGAYGGGSGSDGGGGGGSGGSSDAGSGAPLPPQCTDLATAMCNQMAKCDTFDMEESFGNDQSTCVTQMLSSCPSVSEPGTSNTPASIEACASAISQISSCDAYLVYVNNLNGGSLCPTAPGTLADGAECLDDSQCKGGFCGSSAGDGGFSSSDCGVCAAEPETTDCQENSNCPTGQLCNANGQCVAAGAAGATCDDSDPWFAVQPCLPYLYCQFAAASADGGTPATGTCAALGTPGQPCNASDDVNDCADGLFCNTQGTCEAIQFVAIGATCDDVGLVCTGANCAFTGDASATGVCTVYAADGAACQSTDDCEFDAACVNGTCSTAAPVCNP
jgi:hypothetical protein